MTREPFENTERRRRARPPIDADGLQSMALRYVGRYATTRAKLVLYLRRKLKERGWAGKGEPDVTALAERFTQLGYVDDRGFATARGEALTRRGYGATRVGQALRAAGISEDDGAAAQDHARSLALSSALAFARRRRIGPFAASPGDADTIRRAMGALIRAGHDFALARRIASAAPGDDLEEGQG